MKSPAPDRNGRKTISASVALFGIIFVSLVLAGCGASVTQVDQEFLYWDSNYKTMKELDKEIPLHYMGVSRPKEYTVIVRGKELTRGSTCESASLKALIAMQATAKKLEADAIINLTPSWEYRPLTSEDGLSYTCEVGFSGNFYGIEWEGEFVKVTNPNVIEMGGGPAMEVDFEYEFEPSAPNLEDVERGIVEKVLAADWGDAGKTNYEAIDGGNPGGKWTAQPIEMTRYEVIYTLESRSWHWTVNLNTDEVTFVEIKE